MVAALVFSTTVKTSRMLRRRSALPCASAFTTSPKKDVQMRHIKLTDAAVHSIYRGSCLLLMFAFLRNYDISFSNGGDTCLFNLYCFLIRYKYHIRGNFRGLPIFAVFRGQYESAKIKIAKYFPISVKESATSSSPVVTNSFPLPR